MHGSLGRWLNRCLSLCVQSELASVCSRTTGAEDFHECTQYLCPGALGLIRLNLLVSPSVHCLASPCHLVNPLYHSFIPRSPRSLRFEYLHLNYRTVEWKRQSLEPEERAIVCCDPNLLVAYYGPDPNSQSDALNLWSSSSRGVGVVWLLWCSCHRPATYHPISST